MRPLRLIPHLLVLVTLATLILVVKEWAYAATYRLYLDHRVDDPAQSSARQRFDLGPDGVVPRIVARDERVSFQAAIGQDATILASVSAASGGSYEIHVRQGARDTVVSRGSVTAPVSIASPFPGGTGVVEIVSHGELTWSDLRLRRSVRIGPEVALLGVLMVTALLWRHAGATGRIREAQPFTARERTLWFSIVTALASVAVVVLVLEGSLRAASKHLPAAMLALRRNLGEPAEDPRWQQLPRYGQRLRANVGGAPNEWRDGDIIRMGFISPVMSERRVHRYTFHTDSEGFRNAKTRDPIDIAALGDSFTDALTMAADAAWPAQLEALLGRVVQNYGTAGFGPQQERFVLEDFALAHHPRVIVLAFFAGNDIRDAERFDEFQHGDNTFTQPTIGWPIQNIFTRADTWYVTSLIRAAAVTTPQDAPLHAEAVATDPAPPLPEGPRFDRGVFTVPVNGHVLRVAFMPPYLNLLTFAEHDLAARRGWALALDNIHGMQRDAKGAGAEFVLMFIPFKSQVYLPLFERTFPHADLVQALQSSLPDSTKGVDIAMLSRNRLAQNGLMRRFSEQAGIPFLDLTAVLQERVERGENMYFPDDSHLNEAGQSVTAAALARFIEERRLIKTP